MFFAFLDNLQKNYRNSTRLQAQKPQAKPSLFVPNYPSCRQEKSQKSIISRFPG